MVMRMPVLGTACSPAARHAHLVHTACSGAVIVEPDELNRFQLLLLFSRSAHQSMLIAQRQEEVALRQVVGETAVRRRVHQVHIPPQPTKVDRIRKVCPCEKARFSNCVDEMLDIIKLFVVSIVAVACTGATDRG